MAQMTETKLDIEGSGWGAKDQPPKLNGMESKEL